MSEELTTLELGNHTIMSYRIHPSVPLQMMEFYYRRTDQYVVGTLLGHIDYTHIDITNCYAVPFLDAKQNDDKEDDKTEPRKAEYIVDKEYNKKMYEMNHKIYPNEVVVGWFANFPDLTYDIAPIYHFYSSKDSMFKGKQHFLNFPLVVLFDPLAKDTSFNLRGYVNQQLYFAKDAFGLFQQINLSYEFFNESKTEVAPLWLSTKQKDNEKVNPFGLINLDSLEDQIEETLRSISKIEDYVKSVQDGKEAGDPETGKTIKKLLSMAPSIDEGQFKSLLETYKQDIIMVMYLNNLAGSQNLISEKLSKIV